MLSQTDLKRVGEQQQLKDAKARKKKLNMSMKYLKVTRSNTVFKPPGSQGTTEDTGSHLKALPTAKNGRT